MLSVVLLLRLVGTRLNHVCYVETYPVGRLITLVLSGVHDQPLTAFADATTVMGSVTGDS